MSFGIWSRTVRDGEGNVIDDAEVEVREVQDPDNAEASPITLATIYDDFGGTTEKSNPFTVDGDGRAEFYADGDFYHVIVSRDGVDAVYLNQQLGTAQARDLVVGADGNVPAWDANGNLVDSGQAAADIGSGGGASALDDLSDVTITSPADDDLLAYDSGSSEFINQSKSEAGFGDAATKGVTGADANAVTGTAGTAGNLGEWNADGDLVDTGIASSAVFTQSSDVDHDQTTGFVANEHVDHSTVNVDAGDGLTGGGDLTATRTLSLDPAGATAATIAGDDDVLFGDTSNAGAVRRATAQEIADLGGGGAIVFEPPVSSDPTIEEAFTDITLSGVDQYQGGVDTGDGRILFVAWDQEFYLFDPATDTGSVGPDPGESVGNDGAFAGGVRIDDGRIILPPMESANVGIFDPSDDSYTSGPAHGEGADAFFDAVQVSDGRVIFSPLLSANVGIFDPSSDSYTSGPAHGEGDYAFRGAVLLSDGRVLFVPEGSANIGLFDPTDDSYISGPAHGEGDDAFYFGVEIADGRVILCPWLSANVGIFDPSDDSYTSGPAHGKGNYAYAGIAEDENGIVILAPRFADAVGKFDPSDDSFSTFGAISSPSNEYAGAINSPVDTRVIFPKFDGSAGAGAYQPEQTDAYAIDFGEDVPDGYVAQGWFQPNETTTPTLRNTGGEPSTAIPIVNRDGSDLAIGALDGAHRVYRDGASPDVWYLLDPVREIGIDVEDDGTVVLNDVPSVNFGNGLGVQDDGDGSVTVELGAFAPEHATDSGTDAFVSAINTTPPGDGKTITRDFQSANTTTTPTLDGITITTRDGSALWDGALSGAHELQYDSGASAYRVLYPFAPTVESFRLYASTAQSFPSATATQVAVDQVDFQYGGGQADLANNQYVVGRSGLYQLFFQFYLVATNSDVSRLQLGSTGSAGLFLNMDSIGNPRVQSGTLAHLNAGDTVTFSIYQANSGGSSYDSEPGIDNVYMAGALVRPD